MIKILVPVDFSGNSLNALFYAIKLFEASEIEITVLNTYETSSSTFQMKSIDSLLEKDAQREMAILINKVKEKEPNTFLRPMVMKGGAVSIITSLGNRGDYDFIVMGTKGASGLKQVFLGSVAGGVILKTKAPVIVVPDNYQYRPLKEIVFAISGIPFSSASVVEPLRRLAKLHLSKINVLHVSESEKLDMQNVLSTIEDLNPIVTYAFGTGKINERLNEYMTKEDADLLCLLKSKKDFISRIFDESVTLKQTFNSPAPLLVLHN